MYAKYQLHPPYGFLAEDVLTLKNTLFVALATDQNQRFGQKSYQTYIISVKKSKHLIETEMFFFFNFHFFYYKYMGTTSCHSNKSSYLTGRRTDGWTYGRRIPAYTG